MLNAIGYIFRQKNLPMACLKLDLLQRQYDQNDNLVVHSGYRMQPITPELFLENKRLYKELVKTHKDNYKIRIEGGTLSVYSNDKLWIETIRKISESPTELWAPRKECERDLDSETNIILTRHPVEFEYKITLSSVAPVDPGLASWIKANPDKAKASDLCLGVIERNEYPRGQYFFVRDENALRLLSFIIGRPGRIDKLVYVEAGDK